MTASYDWTIHSEEHLLELLKKMPNGNCTFDFSKTRTYPYEVHVRIEGDNWSIKQNTVQ